MTKREITKMTSILSVLVKAYALLGARREIGGLTALSAVANRRPGPKRAAREVGHQARALAEQHLSGALTDAVKYANVRKAFRTSIASLRRRLGPSIIRRVVDSSARD